MAVYTWHASETYYHVWLSTGFPMNGLICHAGGLKYLTVPLLQRLLRARS